jgi:hypothetical protein
MTLVYAMEHAAALASDAIERAFRILHCPPSRVEIDELSDQPSV